MQNNFNGVSVVAASWEVSCIENIEFGNTNINKKVYPFKNTWVHK